MLALDFSDWSNWSDGSGKFNLASDVGNSYKAYADYSLYLNQALTQAGIKGFNQVVFETEKSGYSSAALFSPNGDLSTANYPGNSYLLGLNHASNWQSLFAADSTTGPTINWNSALGGFGSANNLAQVYDLNSTNYSPAWPNPAMQPAPNAPKIIASDFANFFADSTPGKPIASALNNIKEMVSGATNTAMPGTSFNPNATFVFTYGLSSSDDPVFQNAQFKNGQFPDLTKDYAWNAADFTNFVQNFRNQLTSNLQTAESKVGTTGAYTNTQDLSIGVWGGERALDAWFGLS